MKNVYNDFFRFYGFQQRGIWMPDLFLNEVDEKQILKYIRLGLYMSYEDDLDKFLVSTSCSCFQN